MIRASMRVTELASPVGVVFAVAPVTNPVATAMFKTLIAVKSRNAVILSFHHQALGVGQRTVGIVREVLQAHGAPADLVQASSGRAARRPAVHAPCGSSARPGDRQQGRGMHTLAKGRKGWRVYAVRQG